MKFLFNLVFVIYISLAVFFPTNANATIPTEDGQVLANRIAKSSAHSVYNVNIEQLNTLLKLMLAENTDIQALNIIDSIDNQSLISFYREDGLMIFNEPIPDNLKRLNQYSSVINYENENIGKLVIYYLEKQQAGIVNFNNKEKKWIKSNVVRVGVDNWEPYYFYKNGKAHGIIADYLENIISNTGLKVEYVPGEWNSLLEGFKAGEIDLIPNTYFSNEREKYGFFSKPYFSINDRVYVKKDNYLVGSIEDLTGKNIAIQKGFATIEQIRKINPGVKIIETNSFQEAVNFVMDGKADAFVESEIKALDYFNKNAITELRGVIDRSFIPNKLYFFSNIKKPVLANIIQKGLDAITQQEQSQIQNLWRGNNEQIIFTPKEQAWLEKHIPIKYVYDIDWAPFEWKNEVGQHVGIIADILHLISSKSGLDFVPVHSNSWNDAVAKVKDKTADMYSGVGITKERETYMNFTSHGI
ncbi:MAG: transporter substrate-binding domain-containing protein, partial [Gammaproteobacteria bacterium]|nr:transporter substrate-binding domain-containing protein [Gammaproteobacteria bacterium]